MKKLLLSVIVLLTSTTCYAAAPSRVSSYVAGTTIRASEVTANEDAIFNYLQAGTDTFATGSILNTHIGASAGITASKLDLSSISSNISLSGSFTNSGAASFTSTVSMSGDVDISGSLDMNSKQIDNVLDPTADQDAATKVYVDGKFNTTTGHDHDGSDSKSIPMANLGTGTPGATNFLRGDGSWNTPANSSNVIFCWNGMDNSVANQNALIYATTLDLADDAFATTFFYFYTTGTTYRTILVSKFVKVAGISTVTINARIATDASDRTGTLLVNIGGQTGTATRTATTFDWATPGTIDVSGLTNGTTYDITIQLKNGTSGGRTACSAVILTGS